MRRDVETRRCSPAGEVHLGMEATKLDHYQHVPEVAKCHQEAPLNQRAFHHDGHLASTRARSTQEEGPLR